MTGRDAARANRKEPHMLGTTIRTFGRHLLRRTNDYTLWAFNPQPELTSRYTRG
ncbi:MAG: hypothetical protein QOH37_577 [Nocardioidaceae bacterium]|jgi:hypothetical protein|nr:hypothetical protein [Nocardioidaceae bacterium]